ncbi:MAG: hypothetical protein MUO94_06770 [Thermoplasmata archaeon]|jgi:hypothetical protein|nr:hypothetical protein [Thermoplasmata archaeon]
MIAVIDAALGILVVVSVFILLVSVASYRRSGVLSVLLVVVVLTVHIVLTISIFVAGHFTDVLEGVDGLQLLALNASLLIVALLVGVLGGRTVAGPP